MKVIIFALFIFFPISTNAADFFKTIVQDSIQISSEEDQKKKLLKIRKSLKDLERSMERRQRSQQQAPVYPTKK